MILVHPAYDDPEMKEITRDHPNFGSAWRQIDTEFFSSPQCKDLLRKKGVQMINWKQIRKLI
jgi:hypothetical protein